MVSLQSIWPAQDVEKLLPMPRSCGESLSDGDSLRYILALGLRTLTLQTGDEYRDRIGLDNSELAVLIGSKAITELHGQTNDDFLKDKQPGSESLEPLLIEDVDYDCDIPEEGFLNCAQTKTRPSISVCACAGLHHRSHNCCDGKQAGWSLYPAEFTSDVIRFSY